MTDSLIAETENNVNADTHDIAHDINGKPLSSKLLSTLDKIQESFENIGVDQLHKHGDESVFIKSYIDYATQATDAPIEFAEAGALMCLSSISMRYRRTMQGIIPNLFIILTGPSTKCRKSTSCDLAMKIISAVVPDREGPTDITPEGLLKIMSDTPKRQGRNTLVLCFSEFGRILSASTRTFGVGLGASLCDLYDGAKIFRTRSTSDDITVNDPMVSLIGGCAYRMFDLYTSAEDWGSGFFGRLLMIPGSQSREVKMMIPIADPALKTEAIYNLQYLHDYIKNTSNPNDSKGLALDISEEAVEIYINALKTEFVDLGDDEDLAAYRERIYVTMIKCALLYQIDINPDLPISRLAMQKSINFCRIAWIGGAKIKRQCTKSEIRRNWYKAINFMLKHKDEAPILDRRLHCALKVGRKDYEEVISLLVKFNAISRTFKMDNDKRALAYHLINPRFELDAL